MFVELDLLDSPVSRHAAVMRTILAVPGSLRRQSYNRKLLRAAAELAPLGFRVIPYEDLAAVPLFDEDLEEKTQGNPPGVDALRRAVAAADGLLISTPEYNWAPPGVLKNALDWLSRPAPAEVLAGKPVAVMGASSGRWGTRLAQAGLRQALTATESLVLPAPALFVAEAGRLFDEEGRLVDPQVRRQLTALLDAFAAWIAVAGARSVYVPQANN
jgi:chromate reductase, NAD(P)H dehydrogenase (quinone)